MLNVLQGGEQLGRGRNETGPRLGFPWQVPDRTSQQEEIASTSIQCKYPVLHRIPVG